MTIGEYLEIMANLLKVLADDDLIPELKEDLWAEVANMFYCVRKEFSRNPRDLEEILLSAVREI